MITIPETPHIIAAEQALINAETYRQAMETKLRDARAASTVAASAHAPGDPASLRLWKMQLEDLAAAHDAANTTLRQAQWAEGEARREVERERTAVMRALESLAAARNALTVKMRALATHRHDLEVAQVLGSGEAIYRPRVIAAEADLETAHVALDRARSHAAEIGLDLPPEESVRQPEIPETNPVGHALPASVIWQAGVPVYRNRAGEIVDRQGQPIT